MAMQSPCRITPRLLPGLRLGDIGWAPIEYAGGFEDPKRDACRSDLDLGGLEHIEEGLRITQGKWAHMRRS